MACLGGGLLVALANRPKLQSDSGPYSTRQSLLVPAARRWRRSVPVRRPRNGGDMARDAGTWGLILVIIVGPTRLWAARVHSVGWEFQLRRRLNAML
ncbi:hypothetical protein E5D57_000977 [Metarhizium anisopliae]|nr:hypothetical protein E5D57_000977 [Metarhizium anisopliae]